MFEKFSRKKTIIAGIITLIPLNLLAFYLVNQSIGIADALEHVDEQKVAESLHQKGLFYNVLSAGIITLDFAFILMMLYFLFKTVTKSLKNSNQ